MTTLMIAAVVTTAEVAPEMTITTMSERTSVLPTTDRTHPVNMPPL